MGLVLQLLALATLVQTAQRTTMGGCSTSFQNFFLQHCSTLKFSHFESVSHLHQWTALSCSVNYW